ncbi:Rieske (2Fe-2S) protein [Streptomyces cocklensis]|jgi:ubiquinol-cytochrome c reductase iron-sulfur subunit|uniref:Cytochrome bc1 complex Rieske iron-sulfur subunit n=1 Tax=Actinacidiphila cocklensis TaxID=887465 RepID=A0A9W4E8R0_9ACTN|nr:Rieske 2Fe-2S domain-containing protein [Actinacidiphila cocklensis]MDD1060355.1 Rieske (2Fe-2S) protein [Actinacidiphila cocklensis]WSX74100.1 Rieske (2Fe-2S) protein [Streptomyces sp. NBC_00899]WSX79835.1 Rieske (2Fe-2S) protein [Streptomyces sp. NBC_00899]CAG6395699.1 Cytochrome bc1 complex Rieske iron-sulfur subunit [Actinacidiphila cocklensis]
MSETGSHNDMAEPEEHLPATHGAHGAEAAVPGDPFANPGHPEHEYRRQDIDEKAAKHSERVVAGLFTLSMLGTLAFITSFVIFPVDKYVYIFPLGHVSALNFSLGISLAVALLGIGTGAVHWARTLMSDEEMPDDRHQADADDELRANIEAQWKQGAKESAFGRRKLVRTTMLGALTLVPLSAVVILRDLGPMPQDKLRHTAWAKGKALINPNTNKPLRPEDIPVGSLTFAQPEGLNEEDEDFQQQIAKAALMVVRLKPEDIKDKKELDWSHQGIVAFSKICTHVGCPVSLYEQQTHHVLCPCHQSTFDLSDGARVIFGPAGHRLPQLRISVNGEGNLVAMSDFEVPVGPAFWERG